MEACDLFSETMELHSEDVEYFYIESKRVTERRKRERDNLRREISILKEEKEELREENQQLRRTNKQLKERLSVKEGKMYGVLDEDSNINTFTERPLPGAMVKGKLYAAGSEQVSFCISWNLTFSFSIAFGLIQLLESLTSIRETFQICKVVAIAFLKYSCKYFTLHRWLSLHLLLRRN